MPSASVSTATIVNPGFFASVRAPYRRSCIKFSSMVCTLSEVTLAFERYNLGCNLCLHSFNPPSSGRKARNSSLVEHRGERLHQERLLLGKYRAQVEDQTVVFDAGDYGDPRRRTSQALFEFRRGVSRAGDPNNLRGKRLRRCRSAAGERSPIRDFNFHFVEW